MANGWADGRRAMPWCRSMASGCRKRTSRPRPRPWRWRPMTRASASPAPRDAPSRCSPWEPAVTAVDADPNRIHLAALKLAAIRALDREEALRSLGYLPASPPSDDGASRRLRIAARGNASLLEGPPARRRRRALMGRGATELHPPPLLPPGAPNPGPAAAGRAVPPALAGGASGVLRRSDREAGARALFARRLRQAGLREAIESESLRFRSSSRPLGDQFFNHFRNSARPGQRRRTTSCSSRCWAGSSTPRVSPACLSRPGIEVLRSASTGSNSAPRVSGSSSSPSRPAASPSCTSRTSSTELRGGVHRLAANGGGAASQAGAPGVALAPRRTGPCRSRSGRQCTVNLALGGEARGDRSVPVLRDRPRHGGRGGGLRDRAAPVEGPAAPHLRRRGEPARREPGLPNPRRLQLPLRAGSGLLRLARRRLRLLRIRGRVPRGPARGLRPLRPRREARWREAKSSPIQATRGSCPGSAAGPPSSGRRRWRQSRRWRRPALAWPS